MLSRVNALCGFNQRPIQPRQVLSLAGGQDGAGWGGYTIRARMLHADVGTGMGSYATRDIKNSRFMRALLRAGAGGPWNAFYSYLGNMAFIAQDGVTQYHWTDAKNLMPLQVNGAPLIYLAAGASVWTDWIALAYEGVGLICTSYTSGAGTIAQSPGLAASMYGYWATGNSSMATNVDLSGGGWTYQAAIWMGCVGIQFG